MRIALKGWPARIGQQRVFFIHGRAGGSKERRGLGLYGKAEAFSAGETAAVLTRDKDFAWGISQVEPVEDPHPADVLTHDPPSPGHDEAAPLASEE
ncbi:hypothetical protein Pta02_00850 [Planobispora takensis]|uniref:Uncharacterized protein n=1 Tax=Planobispora takensis TaxID=1367882 RepID=A0A8J3SSG8_9ACTN|nr:hypothetical protein Pta02_00850 [Planobispora takensis]